MGRLVRLALVAALVAASPAVAHSLAPTDGDRATSDARTVENVDYVTPARNGTVRLWPYTSRRKAFEGATLPINVVVRADAATVYRVMLAGGASGLGLRWDETTGAWESESTDGEWEPGPPEAVTLNGTDVRWARSHGAARYTFVRTPTGDRWFDATYQLHDGAYFGARYHLRLYEGGSGEQVWTAVQAHYEYWDWFRLRHDVTSLSKARHHVERDFLGSGLVADVSRTRYGNGGAIDADGWVTVVTLRERVIGGPKDSHPGSRTPTSRAIAWIAAAGLVSAGIGDASAETPARLLERVRASRVGTTHLALVASTALLPLVVRAGAIAAERTFPGASPLVVGGPFYLLLVLGLPACAAAFGRRLPFEDGFAAAVLGMGAGVVADYAYVGIATIPIGAVVQRAVLLVGLGLVAAGGTRWGATLLDRHRYRLAGVVVWVGGLAWPFV